MTSLLRIDNSSTEDSHFVKNILKLSDTGGWVTVWDGLKLTENLLTELSKIPKLKTIQNLMQPTINTTLQDMSYILLMEDVNILLKSRLMAFLNLRGNYLYIFPSEVTEDMVVKILTDLWCNGIYNATLLSKTTGQLYTWYPYQKNNCNCSVKIVLENVHISGNISSLKKNVSDSYNGCRLNVLWSYHELATKDPDNVEDPG